MTLKRKSHTVSFKQPGENTGEKELSPSGILKIFILVKCFIKTACQNC